MGDDWPIRLAAHATGAASRSALLQAALGHARQLLEAPICMLLHRSGGHAGSTHVHVGMRAEHVREYFDVWRAHDPVLRAAMERKAAVRAGDVARALAREAFHAGFVGRLHAADYIVAPLYGPEGAICGALHAFRYAGARSFAPADASLATAFAAFTSVILARKPAFAAVNAPLAAREHQVAVLAARGLSNKDIASELGLAAETIKQTLRRVYRKLGVQRRTELAAQYARAGLL